MFVPYVPRVNYPTAEEIAKAILDEKEKRDKEARAKAEKERREAEEKAEEAQFWEGLGAEMVFQAEEDKKKPIRERYAEAVKDGDVVGAAILYDKMEKEGKK